MTADEALAQAGAFLDQAGEAQARRVLPALAPYLGTAVVTLGADDARQRLAAAVAGATEPVIHFGALPPARFGDLIRAIDGPRDPARLRLVLEKPLGSNLAEAEQIEALLAERLDESQIYRIDHYLGKQAVLNLLALRLGNRVFDPLFNREHVASVQITIAEQLGVEDRAPFYDQTGALRDMVQSHMLQLLATLAMEPPIDLEADSLRDEKLKVLRALRVPSFDGSTLKAVFGQYGAPRRTRGEGVDPGTGVDDRAPDKDDASGRAYRDEPGVRTDSMTETFVAFHTEVRTWRWAGVPFLVRTGKRLPERLAEIVVQFREVPVPLFRSVAGRWAGNRLVVRLQPEDRLQLHLLAKEPGDRQRLRPVMLDLDFFDTWRVPIRDAYERLLTDILRGRLDLFLRGDEVRAQWRFVDALRQAFLAAGSPLAPYPAGTWGPRAAGLLALEAGATWAERWRRARRQGQATS
jgi:glucose-6-phosphate 1-dehydrogenase